MRKTLTNEQIAWADNLREIWNRKKKELSLTQEKAGHMLGWTQGGVGHYLNKKIPLNTDAKIKFAKLLEVNVTEIDPEFSFELHEINETHGQYQTLRTGMTEEETDLLRTLVELVLSQYPDASAKTQARAISGLYASCLKTGRSSSEIDVFVLDAVMSSSI